VNFFEYINVPQELFWKAYVDAGWVQASYHDEFPLWIFTYTRKAVHENNWDGVISKCRGIIVNSETDDIVARPFEKFHNYGSPQDELAPDHGEPVIWEKLDGFLCTLYTWEGVDYIASKGSFHSEHARWATTWYREHIGLSGGWREGWTPIFEGLCRKLRVVVDYKDREGLVLLAVINNETGEEELPVDERFDLPQRERSPMMELVSDVDDLGSSPDEVAEGFVLTWYRKGTTPYRLKLKYSEYYRLHKLVTGVSPKRIWELLSSGQEDDLRNLRDFEVPWFQAFTTKWINALNKRYSEILTHATAGFTQAQAELEQFSKDNWNNPLAIRKEYAKRFTTPENQPYSAPMFMMLDRKDYVTAIWKRVRDLTKNQQPLVDAHNT
jgi:RNA ligase